MESKRANEKRFNRYFLNDTVITAENVKHIGEIITIFAMKKVMPFCNNRLDKLYTGLIHDVFDYKPYNEPYSDGYDLAQTACFYANIWAKDWTPLTRR